MTKEEFSALPAGTRLEVLFDALRDQMTAMPVPTASPTAAATQWDPSTRAPKYDAKLARRGGYVFMSEMTLSDLEWWLTKKRESVASGSKYAAKDAKTAAELERWITWRRQSPSEAWSGIRGEARVTAAVPRRDPELHSWDELTELPPEPSTSGGLYSDEDYGGGSDEEIPF